MTDLTSLPPGMHPAYRRALLQEMKREFVNDLVRLLAKGSNNNGVNLTANECTYLLNVLRPKPKPSPKKGPPPLDWDEIHRIATWVFQHMYMRERSPGNDGWRWWEWDERGPLMTKSEAVKATAEEFGISESKVWKACRASDKEMTRKAHCK